MGAPGYWTASATSLPGLVRQATSNLKGRPIVIIGCDRIEDGQRLAWILAGLYAPVENDVPNPAWKMPVIVLEPASPSLMQLEKRGRAGNLTVLVTRSDPAGWRAGLPHELVATVVLGEGEASDPPPLQALQHHFPRLGEPGINELASVMHTLRFSPGGRVVTGGQPIGSAAWVSAGYLHVGDRKLGPGSMIGAAELFHRGIALHDATAEGEVVLDVLSHAAFDLLADETPNAVPAIERSAIQQLVQLDLGSTPRSEAEISHLKKTLGRAAVTRPRPLTEDWKLLWERVRTPPFGRVHQKELRSGFPACAAACSRPGRPSTTSEARPTSRCWCSRASSSFRGRAGSRVSAPGSSLDSLGSSRSLAASAVSPPS